MTEEFIYYLWQFGLIQPPLTTRNGEQVVVINPGQRNVNSGPDFFNSRLKIGVTEWAGNVEIHVKSSDWIKHGHDTDANYDSVILHLVYECDLDIRTTKGEEIPCIEIKGKFDDSLFFRYRNLLGQRDWIACASQLKELPDLLIYSWLDRLLAERLEYKTSYIENFLKMSNGNWETAFYYALARNFGFNVNSEPFEQLARSIPLDVLSKNRDNLFSLEAILFGQSGMLNSRLNDEYSKALIKEFEYLAKKYSLEPIAGYQWKFMRLRPSNFPTIRIAQFAQLILKSNHLLSKIIQADKLIQLEEMFKLSTSEYWVDHYTFGKKSKASEKRLGKSSFDLILINTIVPFLFVYGSHQHNVELQEKALSFLNQVNAEKNSVVKRFSESGVKANTAGHSQALLTLRNDYCKDLRCLECAIGNKLIKK